MIAKNPKIIMTEQEYIDRLKYLASESTKYSNKYPYNLLYVNDGYITGDCLNTIKALLNGYNVNKHTKGYYQKSLTNTGDCTEAELLAQCTDVSSDFKKITAPAILYMRGHVGSFIPVTTKNGYQYNCIECTTSFGGGIVYSWVDSDGTRRKCKGGVANKKWTQWGKPSRWLSKPVETPNSQGNNKVDVSMLPILRKGSTGKYVKIMQQLLVDKGYDPKGVDGIFGNGCLACVKKYQKENTDINGKKLVVDGMVGQKTWGSLYK